MWMLIHHKSLAGYASIHLLESNSLKAKFNNSDHRYKGGSIAFNWVSDVTLVHEDDEKLEAHKVILAASSPFLQPQVHSWDTPGIDFEMYPDGMLAGGYDSPVVDTGAYSYPRVCYLGYKIYPRVIHRAILDTGLPYSPMYTLCNG